MELLRRCMEAVTERESQLGSQLYVDSAIPFVRLTDTFAAATCRDESKRYKLGLDIAQVARGRIVIGCTCGKTANQRICRHVFCLLWELDERGWPVPGRGGLSVVAENSRHFWTRVDALLANTQAKPADRKAHVATSPPTWLNVVENLEYQLLEAKYLERDQLLDLVTVPERLLWFALPAEAAALEAAAILRFHAFASTRQPDGTWSMPAPVDLEEDFDYADARDDQILQLAHTDDREDGYRRSLNKTANIPSTILVEGNTADQVLKLLSETERCYIVDHVSADLDLRSGQPLTFDVGPAWKLVLKAVPDDEAAAESSIRWEPSLRRGDEVRGIADVRVAYENGYVLWPDGLARLKLGDGEWVTLLRSQAELVVPVDELPDFLERLTRLPAIPNLEFAAETGIACSRGVPRGRLSLKRASALDQRLLDADIRIRYGEESFALEDQRDAYWDSANRQLVQRDMEAEAALMRQLSDCGFDAMGREGLSLKINPTQLGALVVRLAGRGWEVVADGLITRMPTNSEWRVSSGTDWFDLHVDLNFDGHHVGLPRILQALRERRDFILLDDGSRGMLPEAWLRRLQLFTEVGDAQADQSVRYKKSQALLLDALLAEQKNVQADVDFGAFCKKLQQFQGIEPSAEPKSFRGELREYQRTGLGWFQYLDTFDFGGCLADDMGLGKTIQVLALLEKRRSRRLKANEARLPSLAVVPKSLVFNWIEEAAKFTPKLRVLNYTGIDRLRHKDRFADIDLIITTYGTLRRDIVELKDCEFDYVILDEAQAIKNATSQAAKACQLLTSRRRLAMTGTPVENHLGELWSLFDFLNPGIFGRNDRFRQATRGNGEMDPETLRLLSRAIQPFMLRRTKQQVLRELPEKTEQTLFCDMNKAQTKLYGELRDHYRLHLSGTVKQKGFAKAKIHVLEALLRLRQAACDPRLLDQKQAVGAKLELLMEQLEEVQEGHKVLVFSQFTSLLALVRAELDARKWDYEYLDGKTRKRGEKVQRFQEDPNCTLFLISLKAGGHGLNLTAADYVYILDPWWNPAVEAQAIDRAHRLGQTKPVMAYRIICRNSVEEKILELQKSKRDLADAIISGSESLISQLSLDDLQFLLT